LIATEVPATLQLMEHKGITYTVLARPGRDEWTWTVYLDDGEIKRGQITGRLRAEERAQRAINDWLRARGRAKNDA